MPTTVADLLKSPTAKKRGINNTPDNELHQKRLEWLCVNVDSVLIVIQRVWPNAKLTSGYRCAALNKAVGGSATSDHPRALA